MANKKISGTEVKEKQGRSGESFDDTMSRIEGLVEKLESGDLSLEESLESFEEGMKLVRKAEEVLEQAEKRVEILVSGGKEGGKEDPSEHQARPFDIGENSDQT